MKKRFAFSLAEVMVTLGLLGVITAMTIPTLTYNYRSKLLETQFRSTYSDIKEISAYLNNEYGDVGEFAHTSRYKDFDNEFMSHIPGAEKVYNIDHSTTDKVGPTLNTLYQQAGSANGVHRFGQNNRGTTVSIFCDNDGIWFDSKGRIWTFNAESNIICVDINGTGAPNMYNVDIFAFIPMDSGQVAQWVYGDSLTNKSDYTGQITLCDIDGLVGSNSHNKTISGSDPQYCTNGPNRQNKQWETETNCVLDLCPFNWPLENIAPTESGRKNRSGTSVSAGDDYWRDYVKYR